MKLTPREPTPEMEDAGKKAAHWSTYVANRVIWRAMHDAAPSGWQPIETAPRDGFVILGNDAEGWAEQAWWDKVRREWWGANTYWTNPHCEPLNPTHWMPLPAPPSEKGE